MTPGPALYEPLTNPATLRTMAGDDALFKELADIIVRSIPHYVQSLEQAVSSKDTAAIRAALHKIKGTLQMVGADHTLQLLDAIGRDIRATGRVPQTGRTDTLMAQLHAIRAEVTTYTVPRPETIKSRNGRQP